MKRFLTLGEGVPNWSLLKEENCTTDINDRFDVVILFPGAQPDTLYSQLFKARRLLVPVINLSGQAVARADYQSDDLSELVLQQALQELQPLSKAVSEADISGSPDYLGLAILGLAHTRDCALNASRQPNVPQSVGYTLLHGIENPRRTLEELAIAGLLERQHFDRLHLCGNCQSSRMHVREECNVCRSSHLQPASLIHHYRCGYQAIESEFSQRDHLQCPKCLKELRHYGVDYDKPAMVQRCLACSHLSEEPAIGFQCNDCGEHTDAEKLETLDWFHYQLTPDGVAAFQAGVLPHRSIDALLGRHLGLCSVAEFAVTATHSTRVAQRFERPLCASEIRIENFDSLKDSFGVSSLSSALLLLGEIIAQTVRNTDLVCARGETIYLLFAETHADNLNAISQRLNQEVEKKITLPISLKIDNFPLQELENFLRRIG